MIPHKLSIVCAACGTSAGPAPTAPGTARAIVLLTDGRVDSYQAGLTDLHSSYMSGSSEPSRPLTLALWQAREAVAMTRRIADEQANVSVYCFGVGRGVDKVHCCSALCAHNTSLRAVVLRRH